MKNVLLFFLLSAFIGTFVFSLQGCEAPQPAPDPCKNKTPASARFSIGERITNYPSGNGLPGIIEVDTVIVSDSDTVMNDQAIVFEALDENDSYEWSIGDDPTIRTGKKIGIWFSSLGGDFPLPSTISVKLTVKKKIDKICFPNDDGVDIVTKKFTIIGLEKNPLAGSYEGYLKSNPTDLFTIKISYLDKVVDKTGEVYNPLPTFMVNNFLKGCNDNLWWWAAAKMSYGFRVINFAQSDQAAVGPCKKISGWIFVNKNGSIQIPFYRIADSIYDTKLVKDVFIGKIKK